jgi:hypothetical protein
MVRVPTGCSPEGMSEVGSRSSERTHGIRGEIYHLIMETGKIHTEDSHVGEIKVFGKNYLSL